MRHVVFKMLLIAILVTPLSAAVRVRVAPTLPLGGMPGVGALGTQLAAPLPLSMSLTQVTLPALPELAPSAAPSVIAAPRLPATAAPVRFKRAAKAVARAVAIPAFKALAEKGRKVQATKGSGHLRQAFDGGLHHGDGAGDVDADFRAPRPEVAPAVEADLAQIVEITRLASVDNVGGSEDGMASQGLIGSYDEAFFRHYLHHPEARLIVAKRGDEVMAYGLYYGKGAVDREDPAQELNAEIIRQVEAAYGADEEIIFFKHAAAKPGAPGGMGPLLLKALMQDALRRKVYLLFGTVVNDEPLRGSRYEVPENPLLRNRASPSSFSRVPGVTRNTGGYLYRNELAAFEQAPGPVHAWDIYAMTLHPSREIPQITIPEANRLP
jgi:hypothetical protein